MLDSICDGALCEQDLRGNELASLPPPWLSCFFCPLYASTPPRQPVADGGEACGGRRNWQGSWQSARLPGCLGGVGRGHPPAQHGFLICRRARDAVRITATSMACRFMLSLCFWQHAKPNSCQASGFANYNPAIPEIRAGPKKSTKGFSDFSHYFRILNFRSRYPHSACSWLNPLSLAVPCPTNSTPHAIIVRHTYQQRPPRQRDSGSNCVLPQSTMLYFVHSD